MKLRLQAVVILVGAVIVGLAAVAFLVGTFWQ